MIFRFIKIKAFKSISNKNLSTSHWQFILSISNCELIVSLRGEQRKASIMTAVSCLQIPDIHLFLPLRLPSWDISAWPAWWSRLHCPDTPGGPETWTRSITNTPESVNTKRRPANREKQSELGASCSTQKQQKKIWNICKPEEEWRRGQGQKRRIEGAAGNLKRRIHEELQGSWSSAQMYVYLPVCSHEASFLLNLEPLRRGFLSLSPSLSAHHDVEISAAVLSPRREQRAVVQQLLQQLLGFFQMLSVWTEAALLVHIQQRLHLTLVTCKQSNIRWDFFGGGFCSKDLKVHSLVFSILSPLSRLISSNELILPMRILPLKKQILYSALI